MPNSLHSSVAGMNKASKGMEKAADGIARVGIENAQTIDQVTLSKDAQEALKTSSTSLEEHAVDFKKHQFAYRANAKVTQLESERFNLFSSIVARHGQ